jgi:hypothetical protein
MHGSREGLAPRGGPLTRRRLLKTLAGQTLAGVVASTGLVAAVPRGPSTARAQLPYLPESPSDPTRIPGGVRDSGHFLPGRGLKVSTINDFDGVVGIAHLFGSGTGFLADGSTMPLTYQVDNRFMVGTYVAVDGVVRQGTFAEF